VNDPERRRLRYAVSMEREIAIFRLGAALLVLPASVAVLVLARPLAAQVFALVGIAVSIGWLIAFLRARTRRDDAPDRHLDIARDGLTIALDGPPISVRWSEIESVEVDEERLVVAMRTLGGEVIDVPPVWEGVGLDELHALIMGTWDDARRPSHS
jgi:hypothetical protein